MGITPREYYIGQILSKIAGTVEPKVCARLAISLADEVLLQTSEKAVQIKQKPIEEPMESSGHHIDIHLTQEDVDGQESS